MISKTELGSLLKVTPQRVSNIWKKVEIDNETIKKGRSRFFSRTAVKKILNHRGIEYSGTKYLSFTNNKGGVGKTSIATTLAKKLCDFGFDILVIDTDPQANSTNYFLKDKIIEQKHVLYNVLKKEIAINDAILEVEPGLSILPSSLLNSRLEHELSTGHRNPATFMKKLLSEIKGFDFIMFDTSPNFSKINFMCSLATDIVFIPTLLTEFSIEGVKMTLGLIKEWTAEYQEFQPDVKILINQLDNRLTTQFGYAGELQATVSEFKEDFDLTICETTVRADNSINRAQAKTSKLLPSSNFYKDISELAVEFLTDEEVAILKSPGI